MLCVFTNNKGGVGKTTLCFNIAATLVAQGKRVLLVDFDPQGNLTTFCRSELNQDGGVLALFHREEPDVQETHIGADLIPGHSAMTERDFFTDGVLDEFGHYVQALRAVVREADPVYDFIFFDMHPTETALHEPILSLADFYIIPTTPDKLSNDMRLYAMSQMPPDAGMALLVNKFRRQQNMSRAYLNMILQDNRAKDIFFLIPEEAAIGKACQKNVPLAQYAKETRSVNETKSLSVFEDIANYLVTYKADNLPIEALDNESSEESEDPEAQEGAEEVGE